MVNFLHAPRLDLKEFRDQFLPAQTRAFHPITVSSHFRPRGKGVPTGLLLNRLSAIERLRDIRNNPVGEETRNNLCFAYYVAAKPIYGGSEAFQLTQTFNAGFKEPFTDQELKGCLRSAQNKDYWFSTERFAEFLDISPDEAEAVGLYKSAASPTARDRRLERDHRIIDLFNKGSNQREISNTLQISRQTVNKVLRQNLDKVVTLASRINEMDQLGKSKQEISLELGCSLRTVERHIGASVKRRTSSISPSNDKVSKNPSIYGLHFVNETEEQAPIKKVSLQQEDR